MGKKMTWEEIKKNYPDEWIAVVNYERISAIGVSGTLVAHHPNKKSFHQSVRELMPQYGKIAVRFTGQLIKNPEVPLLWQISNIN